MRKYIWTLCAVAAIGFVSEAYAQDIKWQDLGQNERNRILAEWKRQSPSQRGPWVEYRDEYLANMPEEQKMRYNEKINERVAREEAQERLFEQQRQKRLEQAERERQQVEEMKAEEKEAITASESAVEAADTIGQETLSEETEQDDSVYADSVHEDSVVKKNKSQKPNDNQKKNEAGIKGMLKNFF